MKKGITKVVFTICITLTVLPTLVQSCRLNQKFNDKIQSWTIEPAMG